MATLFVIGTPIGNLEDITTRALSTLETVDIVLCEDTRVTKKLLNAFDISTPTRSLHQHTTASQYQKYIDMLSEGKDLALVTDAGTPGVSDPGGKFVEAVVKMLGNEVDIVPIPGASAVTSALSVCGFPADRFTFLGFPPHKKGRETFFKSLADIKQTIVFYESTHRIEKAMEQLSSAIPNRKMMLGRELTKLHESIYRGTPTEVTEQLKADSLKGEFVVVVAPAKF